MPDCAKRDQVVLDSQVQPLLGLQFQDALLLETMEEWAFIDEHQLQGWEGGYACITLTGPHLKDGSALPRPVGLKPQAARVTAGEHLKKTRKLRAPRWH